MFIMKIMKLLAFIFEQPSSVGICIVKNKFERYSMFQSRESQVLKGATIKGKNMLPIGSIFFPLKVAPLRIENNF